MKFLNNCIFIIFGIVNSFEEDWSKALKTYDIIPTIKLRSRSIRDSDHNPQSFQFQIFGRNFVTKLHADQSLLSPDFRVCEIDEDNAEHVRHLDVGLLSGSISARDEDLIEGTVRVVTMMSDVLRMNIVFEQENIIVEAKNSTNMIAYKSSDILSKNHDIEGFSHYANFDSSSNEEEVGDTNDEEDEGSRSRSRRSAGDCPSIQYRLCPILLVADYQFYKDIMGGGDIVYTISYLVGLMDDINRIYMQQEFLECGAGFGFQIKDIHIYTSYSRSSNHYNIKKALSPEDILMRFGSEHNTRNLSKFCLGHLFVARPLKSSNSNVLGLSNVAGAQPRRGRASSGGICSTTPLSEKGFNYLANTGLTSFLNSNEKRVLSLQAALVLAHELGHNWGSHHDPEFSPECAPSHDYPGNYIMYPFSVTGIEPNNKKFSNCSLREIRDVLKTKAAKCFVYGTNEAIICGNFRVEGKETCDVGQSSDDPCCLNCQLRPNAVCSDRNDMCCSNCSYSNNSTICQYDCECTHPVYCTGKSTECRKAAAKNEGEICNINSGMEGRCKDGICLNNCEYLGFDNCICESNLSCIVCCRSSSDSKCMPLNFSSFFEFLPDQTPCLYGFCSNGTCIRSYAQPLQRIWTIIEIKDIFSFLKFLKNNIVGTVIVLSLLIWIPVSCIVSHMDRKKFKISTNDGGFEFNDNDIDMNYIKRSKKIK